MATVYYSIHSYSYHCYYLFKGPRDTVHCILKFLKLIIIKRYEEIKHVVFSPSSPLPPTLFFGAESINYFWGKKIVIEKAIAYMCFRR